MWASAAAHASDVSEVGALGVALSLILVLVAIVLSRWQRLGLEGSIAWAALRAGVQLLLVGLALAFVLDPKTPLAVAFAWLAVMLVFAADVARRRAPEVPGIFRLALLANGAALAVSLSVLFGLGIFPLNAQALIPLSGMIVGNAMTAVVLVSRRLVDEVKARRREIEGRLALGIPAPDAARPYVRQALRTALIPQIETTKAVGIVFLPGAMTGLILAGVAPLDAVLVQMVVMYFILGSAATVTTVVTLGLVRTIFTRDHRIAPLRAVAPGG
ncbi:MAG: iron export ABC transporter permease subunit FetB [Solirubrobacteraceae bacterium]